MCAQDTFLDAQHLRDSFPGHEVEIRNNSGGPEPVRPFRITFPPLPTPAAAKAKGKRKVRSGPVWPSCLLAVCLVLKGRAEMVHHEILSSRGRST